MPKFIVTKLVDAYVVYTTEVEAYDKTEARAVASHRSFKGDWEGGDVREFDDHIFPIDEIEEVTE
jgi:hypothetical protein